MSWASAGVGGEETLHSYGAEDFGDVPDEHWAFLENSLPYHEIDSHFFVHANAAADTPLKDQPEFMLHWERFDDPPPHSSGKIMVCGHTSQKSGVPLNSDHAVCIDTWACGGQWLTGFDVTSGVYWQTNERGERRKDVMAALLD